ncbi:MAG: hypothetical protein OQJ77_05265 [Thiovulaceae bacterium]|nr:hypothetical protein [Sulfurimonadaceae bacterium]
MTNTSKQCKAHPCCKRDVFSKGYCRLHISSKFGHIPLTADQFDELLVKEIEDAEKDANGQYNLYWHGLDFPVDHILFNSVNYENVRDRLSDCWINLQDSNIQHIFIATYNIRKLILSDATIHGNTTIGVTDIGEISMVKTNLLGKFHCASRLRKFDALGATFNSEFYFASTVYDLARFNGSGFYGSCHFHSADGFLFGKEADDSFRVVGFDNVIFSRPTQTLFDNVDLRKASFKAVSLVGVRFINTNFYQEEFGRNGIYNEITLLQKSSVNEKNALQRKRELIHEYRQLRMAMENVKDYSKAHDFYIGEMEARQRREWSFMLWLYGKSSFYGTSYTKAFIWMLLLLVIHITITASLTPDFRFTKLFVGYDTLECWGKFADILIHSFSIGTLQRIGLLSNVSNWQTIADIAFRVLFPIQTAMFVLALRNKTKR